MLDSGEMDTFKYVQKDKYKYGEWVINDSPLSQGTERKPCEKGVLRKFIDPTTNLEMTGFFINTNNQLSQLIITTWSKISFCIPQCTQINLNK